MNKRVGHSVLVAESGAIGQQHKSQGKLTSKEADAYSEVDVKEQV